MEVVLAGATGLIGSALASSLRGSGHRVKLLVRGPASGTDVDSWDPARGRLDPTFLAGADAVVCLSGANVGAHRWTAAYKRVLIASRVDTVGTIARSLAEHGGPRIFLAASAVGYYGDTGDRVVEESAPPGSGFLAEMCVRWEAAAEPAVRARVRVAHLRTGIVLAGNGGMLARLRPIVRAGIAGRLGTGRQFIPWISLADEVAAIRFLLEQDVSGPVNLTAPGPVRNAEFMSALGAVLRRPTVLPTPTIAIRLALGELAQEALTGQRAVPARLRAAGFEHEHATLVAALQWALAR